MKKILIFTVILIHSVCSYSQIDTTRVLSDARELQKHANLYFWYATESHHQLKHYHKAKDFCIRSNNLITTNDLNSPWYYEMQELGYNYRITDFQCSLGLTQLKKLNKFLKKRREIAKIYNNEFKGDDRFVIPKINKNIKI